MGDEIRIKGEPSATGERCRFEVDRPVLPDEAAFFSDRTAAAKVSPLAAELLSLPGTASVLIADNVVTLDAEYAVDWPALGVGHVIRRHLGSGQPVVADAYFESLPAEADLKWAIGDLLDREINPAVASHGGYVELIEGEEEQRLHPPRRRLPGLRRGGRHPEARHRESDPRARTDGGRDPRYDRSRRGAESLLLSREVGLG